MSRGISLGAIIAASSMMVLHIFGLFYLQENVVLYDQGGVGGAVWWIVVLWILPITATLILLVDILRNWLRNRRNGKDKL